MKLKLFVDPVTHNRRYELLFDGHIITMALDDYILSHYTEEEIKDIVVRRFTDMIGDMLAKFLHASPAKPFSDDYITKWEVSYNGAPTPWVTLAVDDDNVKLTPYHPGGIVGKGGSEHGLVKSLKKLFPALNSYSYCPVAECNSTYSKNRYSLTSIIQHLNDKHKWSREKIADWLEALDLDISAAQGV